MATNLAPKRFDERLSVLLSLVVVAIVIGAGLVALRGDTYDLRLLSLAGIYAILALALRLTFAEIGELNLGICVLFAIGAYAVAVSSTKFGFGHLAGMLIGIACATALALVVSIVTLRLTGAFFSVATLGLVPVATAIIVNANSVTGGVLGLSNYGGGIAAPIPMLGVSGQLSWMIAIWISVLAIVLADHWLRACRFGRSLNAIRQDPILFASLGFNVTLYKVTAAVISGAVAGFAGSLFAVHEGLISVSTVSLNLLATTIITVVAGGSRIPGGVVAASIILTMTPEYARVLGDYRLMAFGLALIVFLKFLPDGVGPWAVQGLSWIAAIGWPAKVPAVSKGDPSEAVAKHQ